MITIDMPTNLGQFSKMQERFTVQYIDSGFFTAEKGWRHKKRLLNYYEIFFVTAGELYINKGEQDYNIKQYQLLVCPPYSTINGYKESSPNTHFYWLRFATDRFECLKIQSSSIESAQPYKLIELFKDIVFSPQTFALPYALDALTLCLLAQISSLSSLPSPKGYGVARKIAIWIPENATVHTTVQSISNHFGYNKDYLCRLFKAQLGITLKEYILSERLKRSKDLLLNSDYTIKRISHSLGYDNENLFVKFFKYHEGLSPTDFRKSREE